MLPDSQKQPRTLTFQPCAARKIAAKQPTGPAPEITAVRVVVVVDSISTLDRQIGYSVLHQDCSQNVFADFLALP